MFVQIGLNQRKFNDKKGIPPSIRLFESWKKSGSVRQVDFGGRQNVICLTNKKRKAKISIKPKMSINREHKISIELWSAIENKQWGVGIVRTQEMYWHPSNGMWKRMEFKVNPEETIMIDASGKDGWEQGDKVYIDLKSIIVN